MPGNCASCSYLFSNFAGLVVVDHLGNQLALMSIGHRDLNLMGVTIEHDATGCGARCVKSLAAVFVLLHRERIRTRLAERQSR